MAIKWPSPVHFLSVFVARSNKTIHCKPLLFKSIVILCKQRIWENWISNNCIMGRFQLFSLEYLMWVSFKRLTFHRCKGNYGTLHYSCHSGGFLCFCYNRHYFLFFVAMSRLCACISLSFEI